MEDVEDNGNILSMEVTEPYFSFIRGGIKTVEGRKISPTWKKLRTTNKLLITCQHKSPFVVKIKNIRYH